VTLSSRGATALQANPASPQSEPVPPAVTSREPPAAGRRVAWGRGLLISLVIAFAVPTGLGLYADFGDVSTTLAGFQWNLLPALLGLTALNYLARYLRWRKLVQLASGQSPGLRQDLLVFFAGTAMILTPARLGEWAKSYYARRLYGAPVARTAPIPLVERIADSLVMLLLATAGLVLFGWDRAVFVVVGVFAVGAIVALRHRGLLELLLRGAARFPPARRLLPHVEDFHESSRLLLSLTGLSWALSLGLVAWSLECLTFFLVLVGLGSPATWKLVVQAAFIFPLASLAGSFSLVPGGLGVTEAGITGMTQAIVSAPRSVAVASALLVRAVILGFGFTLGLLALAAVTRAPATSSPTAKEALDLVQD
jgi:glycosyltransferase 2 family protein